jgi:hypothetical protein
MTPVTHFVADELPERAHFCISLEGPFRNPHFSSSTFEPEVIF